MTAQTDNSNSDFGHEDRLEKAPEAPDMRKEDTEDTPSYSRMIDQDGRFAPILEPHIRGLGFRLVKVEMTHPKHGPILHVYAEPQEKRRMKVDDCRDLSRTLSAILDVEDPIYESYTLEVSSPGIDRPLTCIEDFDRFKGFTIKITIDPPAENGQKRFKGLLQGRDSAPDGDENDIVIALEDGGELVVGFDNLVKAQLVYSDALYEATKDTVL